MSLLTLHQEKVLESFAKHKRQTVDEVSSHASIALDEAAAVLDGLLKTDMLVKKDETYTLSKNAEKIMPFFAHLTGKEVGNLCIILCAVVHENRILLLKRKKRPYQGYWGFIGGKIKLEDSLEDAAVREVKEETGLDCRFERVNAVLHERVHESGAVKHAFVIFFCSLSLKDAGQAVIESDEGTLKWFSPSEIAPDEFIPSDFFMAKELWKERTVVHEVVQIEEDGKLKDMKIEEI